MNTRCSFYTFSKYCFTVSLFPKSSTSILLTESQSSPTSHLQRDDDAICTYSYNLLIKVYRESLHFHYEELKAGFEKVLFSVSSSSTSSALRSISVSNMRWRRPSMVLYPAEHKHMVTHTVTFSAQVLRTWNRRVTCGADLEHDVGFGFASFSRAEIIVLALHRLHQIIVHMVPTHTHTSIKQ